MKTLFALLFFFVAICARSQNPKAEDFCQYLDQPIQKLLANLKTTAVDTRIGRTSTGTVRNLFLVFADSSYFEIFPVFNKPNSVDKFNLKNYTDYKIKCIFYHVPGDVVDNCGCKNFAPTVLSVPRNTAGQAIKIKNDRIRQAGRFGVPITTGVSQISFEKAIALSSILLRSNN